MKKISVLIIDDSSVIRGLFTEMLRMAEDIEVVGTATDPLDAREKIKQLNPDVLTLDVEMPHMDGLAFLEKIMQLRPMPVVMASSHTEKGAGITLRALELGAVDYVWLQQAGYALRDELIAKIRIAASAKVSVRQFATKHPPTAPLRFSPEEGARKVVAIGASTGGVEALRDLFLDLPANSPPIVITQHMPPSFTAAFAARLNQLSPVKVAEAYSGALLLPGHAWLAPGDRHLTVTKRDSEYFCMLDHGPTVSGHKPSVDKMFASVANTAGADAVGVLLTGMGRDGATGLWQIREAGGHTIAQDEASCVVYGMPRAASAMGAVCEELPLHTIAPQMLRHCEHAGRPSNATFGT